jgi:hypothetical protein
MSSATITISTTTENGRNTTTVYSDGKRVGYVQHTTLWADEVLRGNGTRGRFGRMVNYSWPGQPDYICGSIPADLDAVVRQLVSKQREGIKAARGY